MKRRPFTVCLTLALLAAAPGASGLLASARSKNEEGNRLYLQKKYAEALKRYTEAQLEAPDAPQLHYNLGNVFFRQGEAEKARDEYRRALASAQRSLDPSAVYNLGNTFFSQQQYQDAVAAYQRALKLNPADRDAKRNLELALLRMKQQQQQQKSGDQKDDKHGEKQPSAQDKKEQKDEKGKPGGQQEQGKQPDRPSAKSGAQKPRGGLSREEAEQILNALQEDEKANMKKRLQAAQDNPESVDQDW